MIGVKVISDPDFEASLEYADGRFWVHNEVSRYSKEVLRRLRIALDALHDISGSKELWCLKDLHRMPSAAARKFRKFVTMMGFEPMPDEYSGDNTKCAAFRRCKEPDKGV